MSIEEIEYWKEKYDTIRGRYCMLQYHNTDLKKQNQHLLVELEKLSKQNSKVETRKLHKDIIKLKQELNEERLLNKSMYENAEKAMILHCENKSLNEKLEKLENEYEISKRDLQTVQGLLEMVARSSEKK